jgi:streptogramin lyase
MMRTKILAGTAVLALTLTSLTTASHAAVGDTTEFALPNFSAPYGVVLGPDGNVWVANGGGGNVISRVTPAGTVTNFPLPTPGSNPRFITVGSDGNLWFTQQSTNKIGRMTTAGVLTEFVVPTPDSQPWGIAPGPDGNLWFTELAGNKIGRISTAGVFAEFVIPTANSQPWGITAAPNAAPLMYFTEFNGNKIGTITMDGVITEIPLTAGSNPQGISAVGNDIWFAATGTNRLVRLVGTTPQEIALPAGSAPAMIAAGPGPSMWVTLMNANRVVQLTAAGGIQGSFALPVNAAPIGITMGSDGNMWVAESSLGRIARVLSGQTPLIGDAPAINAASGTGSGSALTVTNGTWLYQPAGFSYAWARCSANDAATCTTVVGNAANYTVQPGDVGQFLRAAVTATNLNGVSAPAFTAILQVGGAAPTPTPTPTPAPTPGTAVVTSTTLDAPNRQKRTKRRAYTAAVSGGATGTVTFTFARNARVRTIANVPLVDGAATVRWKTPKRWPVGPTRVTATFNPTSLNEFTASSVQTRVRIRR